MSAGVAFDQTPVTNDPTVRLPDSDRWWLAFGGEYKWSPHLKLDAGFAYIIVMLLLPVTLVVDRFSGALLVALVVLFAVPWLSSRFLRAFLRTGVHHGGGALS